MKVHFIAIGGAIMHQLAISLAQKGYQVTGSDDVIYNPSLQLLQVAGILPQKFGWFPEKITPEIDAIILGMHAKADNPELLKAQKLGIPIHSFPSYLYEVAKDKERVVIAGSHGKTTITSMLAHVLKQHGHTFDLAVGAAIPGFNHQVILNEAHKTILIEGDEYLSSPIDRRPKFVHYKPHVGVLNGIAWDHINVFNTFNNYVEQFTLFVDGIERDGILYYNKLDKEVIHIIEQTKRKDLTILPYGLPNYKIDNSTFIVQANEQHFDMQFIGEHNLNNMEAAKSLAMYFNISETAFYTSMQSFTGAAKRLQTLLENDNHLVIKDFAHAPSKVTASVKAARQAYTNLPIYAFAELHTYSSMNADFMPQYAGSLDGCDAAIVFIDEHALKIKNMSMPKPKDVLAAFKNKKVKVFMKAEDLKQYAMQLSQHKGVFLMMSSGSWGKTQLPEILAAELSE